MPACLPHSSVLPDDSRASRQRTRVVRRSLNPMFNHTMVYDGFEPADLRQACAELSLWDHGTLASRQLGGTRLSLGTGEWGRTLRGPDGRVALGTSLPFPELWCPLRTGGDVALSGTRRMFLETRAGQCDRAFHPCPPTSRQQLRAPGALDGLHA